MLKAVIFDLNGVFVESEMLSDRVKRDYNVDSQEFIEALKKIMPIVREPDAPASYPLWKPYLDNWEVKISEKEFLDYWFSGESVVKEVAEYVIGLRKRGIKVFVLSNNFKERVDYYKKNFTEIFENIDKAYFSCETGFLKPDEQAFTNILNDNNLKPEECVYFDDSSKNVVVARELGIHAYEYEGLEAVKKVIEENTNNQSFSKTI